MADAVPAQVTVITVLKYNFSFVKCFSSRTVVLVVKCTKIVLLSQSESKGCGLDETGTEMLQGKSRLFWEAA